MSDVTERLRKLVAEHLFIDLEKITEDANFYDDLGADSLDAPEIQLYAEEAFGIELPDGAMATVQTFGDMRKVVQAAVDSK